MSAIPSFASQITTPREDALRNGIKSASFGGAGVGKTRLIATAPSPIVMSADNGTLSLRNEPNVFKLPEIKTLDEFKNQKRWFLESHESRKYYTGCIDSLSSIAQVCLFNEKSKSRDGRAAYGAMNDEVTQIVNDLRQSNRTIYVILQEEFERDENSGVSMWRPNLPGRTLNMDMPYKFDLLMHLKLYPMTKPDGTQGSFGALQCHPSPTVIAKDRSGSLDFFEPPNLEHIFRKILGV